MIGAVVGVQPFGGRGLSGTGPKAGGPWMLARLRRGARAPALPPPAGAAPPPAFTALRRWAQAGGRAGLADACARLAGQTPLGRALDLPGPTGESNRLRLIARGRALCAAADTGELLLQCAAALATGNDVVLDAPGADSLLAQLPDEVRRRATLAAGSASLAVDVALCTAARAPALRRLLAERDGPRVRVLAPDADGGYALEALVAEQTLTVNTAAAGGNAGLMTLAPQ
jgi:RHH-type proline utilization regulon transcriptional repressor/proline dehydrogenase/delta 1-pyrroline-5-carboxylate dehydrogenase